MVTKNGGSGALALGICQSQHPSPAGQRRGPHKESHDYHHSEAAGWELASLPSPELASPPLCLAQGWALGTWMNKRALSSELSALWSQ